MAKLWCLSTTISARIIAAIELLIGILMVNILVSEFYTKSNETEFLLSVDKFTFIGLNWINFIKTSNLNSKGLIVFASCLVFLLTFLTFNCFLAFGTVVKRSKYSIPWLYFQLIIIFDGFLSLMIHLMNKNYFIYKKDSNLIISIIYLLITLYFWMIVYSAYEHFVKRPSTSVSSFSHLTNINILHAPPDNVTSIGNDFNLPKSPSFLSTPSNHFVPPTK